MPSEGALTAEDVCREVYAETRAFYEGADPSFRAKSPGFRILYGPPIRRAPLLILGYQPGVGKGGVAPAVRDQEHDSWPQFCDYATAKWRLASRLQKIWGKALLDDCTGLNSIFFRAQTVNDWYDQPKEMRLAAENFCRPRAKRIVKALSPQRLIVVSLATFDRLTEPTTRETVCHSGKRVLAKRGEIWGVPATGIIHLSGARISKSDRDRLTAYLRKI